MPEKPILFKGPMVRAILDGRKTQTRRVVKCNPFYGGPDWARAFPDGLTTRYLHVPQAGGEYGDKTVQRVYCPYDPGDTLWVRETTESYWLPHILTGEPTSALCGRYTVDDEPILDPRGFDLGWWYSKPRCPSIHMPRWASRITLEVTGVRVERAQDISEADAKAEGVTAQFEPVGLSGAFGLTHLPYSSAFANLWNSINAKRGYSWESNPWLWVVEFKRVDPC